MFEDAARIDRVGDGVWDVWVDPSWSQGPGLFGGLQAAWMMRAWAELESDEMRQPRSMTVAFLGPPQPGEARLEAEVARRGGSLTHLRAVLTQGGGPVASGIGTLAVDRDVAHDRLEVGPPRLPAFATLPEIEVRPPIPTFVRHVDMRFVPGRAPFAGSTEAVTEGWVRFRGAPALDAVTVTALLDVWPPAVVPTFGAPRGTASVDLSYHFFLPFPLEGVEPRHALAFRARSQVVRAGYADEQGELWTPDGRLVARVRQLRVVF